MSGLGEQKTGGLGEQKNGGLGEQKNTYYALAVRILSTNILNNWSPYNVVRT